MALDVKDCSFKFGDATSPFNQRIKNPTIDPNSEKIKANLKAQTGTPGGFGPGCRWTGSTTDDWNHPVYIWTPDSGYPLYTVKLTESWGSAADKTMNGAKIPLDPKAKPAQNASDKHLGVVDPASGIEYDFWCVTAIDHTNRVITARWGGYGPVKGSLLTRQPATAAHFALSAGPVRGIEIAGGTIDHALFAVIRKVYGDKTSGYWPPALGQAQYGGNAAELPHNGQRFYTDLTWAQIDALPEPPWGKAVLRALSAYGAFIGDTGGAAGITLQPESQIAYETLLGYNPLRQYIASTGKANLDVAAVLNRHWDSVHFLAKPA